MSAAISTGYVKSPASGAMPFAILSLYECAPLEQRHRRDRQEQPEELGHLGDVRLAEERDLVARRIEAEREVVERHVARELAELVGVAHRRQRVEIGDEDEALVARVLQLEKLRDRPEIVADVELA